MPQDAAAQYEGAPCNKYVTNKITFLELSIRGLQETYFALVCTFSDPLSIVIFEFQGGRFFKKSMTACNKRVTTIEHQSKMWDCMQQTRNQHKVGRNKRVSTVKKVRATNAYLLCMGLPKIPYKNGGACNKRVTTLY